MKADRVLDARGWGFPWCCLKAVSMLRALESGQILEVLGTGSVVLAFAEHCPGAVLVGYNFSHGMLAKAQEKNVDTRAVFVEGDAAELPFSDNTSTSSAVLMLSMN